jgi:adenylosuccinate lyase
LAVTARIKDGGSNDLLTRLKADPDFQHLNFDSILNPQAMVGRCPEQVDEFLSEHVAAVLARYSGQSSGSENVRV